MADTASLSSVRFLPSGSGLCEQAGAESRENCFASPGLYLGPLDLLTWEQADTWLGRDELRLSVIVQKPKLDISDRNSV